jgi:hypothetical protein
VDRAASWFNLAAGLVGYDIPKKHSNQNKGDRNHDSAYEMLISHSLSQPTADEYPQLTLRSF